MAKLLNKIVDEVIKILKKDIAPGEKKRTIWEILLDQAEMEGTWDENLINAIEKRIEQNLILIKEKELRTMWEDTSAGMDKINEKSISLDIVKLDLINEIINLVMDKLGTHSDFSNDIPSPKYLNVDNEDEEFEDNLDIDIDDIDDFKEDNFSDDEEDDH